MLLRIATIALVCFGLAAAQTCGGVHNLELGGSLEVSSPGYPATYQNNHNCQYSLNAPETEKGVEVNAVFFDLENTYDCVEFFSNGVSKGKFCGSGGPSKLRLSGTITFTFKTDSSVTRGGFVIRFTFAKCFAGEGSCPNHPDVCMASNAWCNGVQDCPDNADEDCPDPDSCGKSAVKPSSGRIVGGIEAVPHSHPWQAAMLTSSGSQLCGGTVIAPFWIMTAAHCCAAYGTAASNYKFRIGSHAYANANEEGASTVTVAKLIMHPSYNSPVRYAHDFCLIKTNERMIFNRNVQPACLCDEAVADNETMTVTGWGNTGANRGDFDDFVRTLKDIESGRIPKGVAQKMLRAESRLRQVNVQKSNQEYCNRAYSGGISSDMVCAAAPGKDSCQGDSGGPLVHNRDGKARLCGVVSWGRGCAQPNYPGVYAYMNFIHPWVLEKLATE